jgi:hypothetical protein
MPNDLPPWAAVYQQTRCWVAAGCFEALVGDVQAILREWKGRKGQPTAVCLDSRTLQSTPESGARAGYDGAERRKGSKVHIAVDTLGHLLVLTVTAADEGDRTQVAALAKEVQQVTGNTVELADVDQGYTGDNAAQQQGIRLEVGQAPHGKTRIRLVAQTLGRRTKLRLGRTPQKARARLRETRYHTQRPPLHRLRHPHVRKNHQNRTYNFITVSSSNLR